MKFRLPTKRALLSLITAKRILLFFILILILFVTVKVYESVVTDAAITPLKNECISVVTETVNKSVADYLTDEVDFPERCFTPVKGSDENIESYSINSVLLAETEQSIVSMIKERLEKSSVIEVNVPIGTLTRIKFFSAKGFSVKVKAYVSTAITSETSSKIESVGINQSLYKVVLTTDISCEIMLNEKSETVSSTQSVTLAEKIIIGSVPLT